MGTGKNRNSIKPEVMKTDPDPAVRQLDFDQDSKRNSIMQKELMAADPLEMTGSEVITPGKRKSRPQTQDPDEEVEEPVGRSRKSAVRRRKQR